MTAPSPGILNALVKLSLAGRGTTTYLTVLVAATIWGGGGGSGGGTGGGTSPDTTTRKVTLDTVPTGTLGMIKSALNVPSFAVWSGGWPSSRKGIFCRARNEPVTVTFVNAAKLLTFTKTELVVSVTRTLPSRGETLTRSDGGGDWPSTGQAKRKHTEPVRITRNLIIIDGLALRIELFN